MSDNTSSLFPKIKSLITKRINYTPFGIHWLPFSTKLISIGESFDSKGVLQIYNLLKGKFSLISEYNQEFPSKCCTLGNSSFASSEIALGDFAGNLSVLDLERGLSNFEIKKAHKGIIHSIDSLEINNEIITGGKDGLVKIWDLRSDKSCLMLEPKDIKKNFPECWAVRFRDYGEGKNIGIGYDNGDIKIFDLRMDKLLFGENLKNGICYIEFDKRNIPTNKMAVTTLGSKLYLYDLANINNNMNKIYEEVNTTIWGAKFLPNKKDMLVSLGGDGNLNLYKYEENELKNINSNNICNAPIIGFDWHLMKNGLACLVSLDNTVRICKL